MTHQTTSDDYTIQPSSCYVKMEYRVRIVNGRVLKGAGQPAIMDFVTGFKQVIPGLEQRLQGRRAGEDMEFTVPAAEAFGERRDDFLIEKDRSDFHFPPGIEPCPGMELPLIAGDNEAPDTVIITEVKENTIVIDLNPPLAGAPLHYELKILEARPARDTDVCSEWENEGEGDSCRNSAPVIVLGADDEEAER